VFVGVGAGVLASFVAALLFTSFAGGFEGTAEQLFEGVTMLLGAVLITLMILWMAKQRKISEHLHGKIEEELAKTRKRAFFSWFSFPCCAKEFETVIFSARPHS